MAQGAVRRFRVKVVHSDTGPSLADLRGALKDWFHHVLVTGRYLKTARSEGNTPTARGD